MDKRGLLIIFGIFLILNLYGANAALGLTPALMETDFHPEDKFLVNFQVLGADSDQGLFVYADGDLSEYVTFDKTNLTGTESFTAYIDLPKEVEKPGKNLLYIKVKEAEGETTGIGTRLEIGALIVIKVPYPGKYAEIKSFNINDANSGEPVNFAVEVESLGSEAIFADVNIKVYSEGSLINSLALGSRLIGPQTSEIFEKTVENGYESGVYNATVTVNYGEELKREKSFRIGDLFIDIINWTSEFKQGRINEFNIDIESKWNNNLNNVYAEVNVTGDGEQKDFFKTPSIALNRWEKATLRGFFNAEDLEPGDYDAKIVLFYENKKTEKTVQIRVISMSALEWAKTNALIIGLILGLIMIVIIIIFYLFFRLKWEKKKKRKKS